MKKLFSNALLCAYRLLLFMPVPLLLGALLPGCSQLTAGLYYSAGQLLALALSFIPSGRRVLLMLIAGAAYIAAGVFALGVPAAPLVLVIIALSVAAYLLSARSQAGQSGRYDTREMVAGVIIHVAIPVVIQLSGAEIDYTAMMWTGMAFLLMLPFVLNDFSVRDGMSLRGRGGKPIKRLSQANRLMVGVMLAVALIIANFERLRAAAQAAAQEIVYWIMYVINWLGSLMETTDETGGGSGGGSGDMGLGLDAAEPSWFAKLTEQIMQYLVIIILIAAAIFVLYKLGKLARRLFARVSAWAKRFAQGVKEDYMEEREQLMDWGDVRSEMLESMRERLRKLTTREKKWGDMDARERVRFVMRQLYRKNAPGVTGIEYLSARQALSEMKLPDQTRDELSALYDSARYSDHDITEAQAEQARKAAKQG